MSDPSRHRWLVVLLFLGLVSCAAHKRGTAEAGSEPSPTATHPLDAPTAAELQRAVQLLREQGHANEHTVFSLVVPWEPPKEELTADAPRRLRVVAYDSAGGRTFEGLVRVTPPEAVERWTHVPGVQPPLGTWDAEKAAELVRRDARWQAALRRRGVTNPEHIYVNTWAMGPSADAKLEGHRLVKSLPFFQGDTRYVYARPVEGLFALVDLTDQKVVEVTDEGDVPIPPEVGAYDEDSVGPLRARPHPVVPTHPEGSNLSLTGNQVRWQNWSFRVLAHPREGPVLQQVTYTDQGRERKILHRLSLSEMVVPYGDPGAAWAWRSAFDIGEYSFAGKASPLDPGGDVPEGTTFLPALFVNASGEVERTPRAIALYERDGGMLWKHYSYAHAHNEVRRGIELVVAFSVAIENYDYVLQYVFKQDGSLEVHVLATGIMLAKGVAPRAAGAGHEDHEASGHLVAEGVLAVHHQHFFNFRLDFDVDGPRNTVLEMNSEALPVGRTNPQGNAFSMKMEPLPTELQARRALSLASGRRWIVVNPHERNALGHPTGYALVPGENSLPFASAENMSRKRAGFIDHPFWATRYAPEELYAAGDYPNQSQGGDGLPTWVKDDQSLVNEDVVVWYTLGMTHTPRPEEWPVMPAAMVGFKLLPVGFFSRNPALDLPKPAAP